MKLVEVEAKSLDAYAEFVDDGYLDRIQEMAASLRGLRVVHVNATPVGGGVAEVLHSLIPLLKGLDINAEWYALDAADDNFFKITKRIHNQLQGEAGELSEAEQEVYLGSSEEICRSLQSLDADIWVFHDPQPAIAGALLNKPGAKVWRSHIDTSTPNSFTWNLLRPYIDVYDAIVYSHESYKLPDGPVDRLHFIAPAIDPLVIKNRFVSTEYLEEAIPRLGMDLYRPLISQISRFDKWKDPEGVIAAYRKVRAQTPGLQLALVGVIEAQDDPEAQAMYAVVKEAAAGDPDIHLFVDPAQIHPQDITAIRVASRVVIQKSLREGFGLTVTEAMWQAKPVVGGDTAGIRLQITDGETGYLVKDIEHCAEETLALIRDEALSRQIGLQGHEYVKSNYLMPRLLFDELALYSATSADVGRPTRTVAPLARAFSRPLLWGDGIQ